MHAPLTVRVSNLGPQSSLSTGVIDRGYCILRVTSPSYVGQKRSKGVTGGIDQLPGSMILFIQCILLRFYKGLLYMYNTHTKFFLGGGHQCEEL